MKFLITIIAIFMFSSHLFAGPGSGIGNAGDEKDVNKIIRVSMFDNSFKPTNIKVKKGQTIKFIIENKGEFVHEFNINTKEGHLKHQPEMTMMTEMEILSPEYIDKEKMMKMAKTNPSMKHDHGNSVLLEPGESDELIWKFGDNSWFYYILNFIFTKKNYITEVEVACNVPGHYEDGMVNKVNFS